MDIYLQLAGIPGTSVERDHRDWIEVTSATWGVEQTGAGGGPASGPGGAGQGGGGGSGKSAQNPLVVSAPTTIATPLIFEAVAKGIHLPTAKLEVVRGSSGRGVVVIRWEFEDVRLTRLDVAGAQPGFDDAFQLIAKRVRLSVSQTTATGAPGQPVARGWDFAAHQPW